LTGFLKVDHQYVALRRQKVVRWAYSPSTEKTLITKEKEEKMGQINTMKTNRSLYRLRITINELRKYKIAIAAIQETRWNKSTPQAFTSNGYNISIPAALPIIMNLEQLF
jgi:hypothetical protein